MRKVVMLNRVSLDGFYAGKNGEIDWFISDPEVDKKAHEVMNPDTLLVGKLTYQMFESYWPHVAKDPKAPEDAKQLANELNEMNKVVFSKTLDNVTWENTHLVKGNGKKDVVPQTVRDLKHGNGKDITIFGSGTIVQALADECLIDEYVMVVTPVVLGEGKALFEDVGKFNLKLLETQNFKSGNVLLHFATQD